MLRSFFILAIITTFLFAGQVAAQDANARDMIGSTVVDRNGENIGTIEDVLFSDTGEASYLILSQAEMGEQVIPVPLVVADPQRTVEGNYIIDVDRRTLAAAPTLTRNTVGDYARADVWEDEVRGYFGVQPVGTDRAILDRQFREPDMDATIELSKESGGLNGSHTAPWQDDMSRETRAHNQDEVVNPPRAYFGEDRYLSEDRWDRYETDMDRTIESSKEGGGLTGTHTAPWRDDVDRQSRAHNQDDIDVDSRAYFGQDYTGSDIDRTIESSRERGYRAE
jgi:sporulation protein YlmC with PRC-barrel domain